MARLGKGRRSSRPKALARSGSPVLSWDPTLNLLQKNPFAFGYTHMGHRLVLTLVVLGVWVFCRLRKPQMSMTFTFSRVRSRSRSRQRRKRNLISSNTSLSARVRPLKVDVDLVLVPVTITDPMNRLVTGLEKENFQLFEGNSAQEIRSFSSEDAPVSLGVIFDSSGSMSSKMDRAKEAVIEFFKTANPQDEFFMITFSDEPEDISDFTSSVDEIQNKLVFAVPKTTHRAARCHLHGRQQDAAGQVSQEGVAHHFRRRRQSQPLHGKRD